MDQKSIKDFLRQQFSTHAAYPEPEHYSNQYNLVRYAVFLIGVRDGSCCLNDLIGRFIQRCRRAFEAAGNAVETVRFVAILVARKWKLTT